MNLVVTIDSVDRTEYIQWRTFIKDDVINDQVDTLTFETKSYGNKNWKPLAGDEIIVTDGINKVFGGVIVSVVESLSGEIFKYEVTCKDWTHYADQTLVTERFEEQTVNAIISYINTNYLTGFTINNVNCNIEIKSIVFNRVPVSQCLQMLAERVNFFYYLDYDKDIHFFAKNNENAPFELTDTNGNYLPQSLVVKDDISQMKNVVYISGAEYKGDEKTFELKGDGAKTVFPLGYKFSNEPTVKLNTVAQDVGVEFLHDDADHDVLWSYGQKYIRFVTAPASGSTIEITGVPLIPITVREQDDASIELYGRYEFFKQNKDLRSKEEARQYALTQLEAYSRKISEGSFETYQSGLRSGQVVNIQSDKRNIDDQFLIQSVSLRMRTPSDGIWIVELATMKTIGIITFLQNLIINQEDIEIDDNEILEKGYYLNETVEVVEEIDKITPKEDHQTVEIEESIEKDPLGAGVAPDFVLAPYIPTGHSDPKREGILDISFTLY